MRNLSLMLCLFLLCGCARYNSVYSDGYSSRSSDPYAQLDFDELLNFSANMAGISAPARSEVCHSLLRSQKGTSGAGVQLHLLVGRLFSDECGDIASILDSVTGIPPGSLRDDRLQKLIAIHTEALKRLNNAPKKIVTVEHKAKTAQPARETKESAGAKKDENRLLREKLDAIRSMEKQLDGTGEGN